MRVIIDSFHLSISPKMSHGVLECDRVYDFCHKRLCNLKGVLFLPDSVPGNTHRREEGVEQRGSGYRCRDMIS